MAINHVWKTVIALFMCVLTIFAFGLKLAVQSHAFAISAGVIGLIAVILGTLGFTFATSAELQRVCTQYYSQAPADIQAAFDAAANLVVDGQIRWNDLKTIFGLGVMSLIASSMTSYMDAGVACTTINGINDFSYSNITNGLGYVVPLAASGLLTVSGYSENYKSVYNILTTSSGVPITVSVGGGSCNSERFAFGYSVSLGSTVLLSVSSSYGARFYRETPGVIDVYQYTAPTHLSIAPCKMVIDGVEYLSIVFVVLGADGIRRYFGSGDAVTALDLNDLDATTTKDWYGQTGAIDDGIVGQAWSDELAKEHDETDVITLTDSLPWIAAHETTDVIDTTYTQSDVLTDVGLQDTVGDLTDTQDTTLPLDIDDYKVPPAWTNPRTGDPIRFADIFPFCIPFDIYDFLSVMAASRTAPHFEIPFKYDRIGLDYTFVLDLSGASWENLAQIVRTLELLAFCVGLAFVTRDMIKG